MLANEKKLPTYDELRRIVKFCVALYRTDKIIQSAYIASNLLELIVDLWLEKQNTHYTDEDSLNNKIYKLDHYGLGYSSSTLINLKLIRNDIVHGYIHTIDVSSVLQLVHFTWEVLDNESYLKCNKNIDQLDLGTAYYWIRDFEVIDTEHIDKPIMDTNSIELSDFNNLYKMDKKFRALSKFISSNKKLGKYSLSVDNISAINSTSAYLWLAITSGKYKGRQKIESSSVSLLATPDNLRIYIDFGGFAFFDREKYLEFLEVTNTKMLNIQDIDNLYIFDIEWYSYIENKVDISILNEEKKYNYISSATQLLKVHDKENPLASNKLLIGYILEKQDLSFDIIWNKLVNIISIYNYFQTFKNEEKNYSIDYVPTKKLADSIEGIFKNR